MATLTFYFANKAGDEWAWKRLDDKGVVTYSRTTFAYYLDALNDARALGHSEAPDFDTSILAGQKVRHRRKL